MDTHKLPFFPIYIDIFSIAQVDSLLVKTKKILPKELISCKRELKRLQKAQQQHIDTREDIDMLRSTVSTLRAKNEATKQVYIYI